MPAEAELLDLMLVERLPRWLVRDALSRVLPEGWTLVELYDVWLAGPPLAGRVVAAGYRATVAPVSEAPGVDADGLRAATERLLRAPRLPRLRQKGGGVVEYDLRPLLIDLAVAEAGPPVRLRMRTRFHPELGTGRPEEVVAAMADAVGVELEVTSIVRERLYLAEDDER
jgi:hypothetical protein